MTENGYGEMTRQVHSDLVRNGPSKTREVAKRTGIDKVKVGRVLDRLRQQGVVNDRATTAGRIIWSAGR